MSIRGNADMVKMYHFMQDKDWYEDIGHILIGLVPFAGWMREHKQWPPGWPYFASRPKHLQTRGPEAELVTQVERVRDSYRDFLGYEIGSLVRTIALVYLCLK